MIVFVTTIVVVLTSAVVAGRPEEATAGAVVCAVPGDCRLKEAGEVAGVRFGFGVGWGDATHEAAVLAEANVSVNHQFSWVAMEPDRGVWNFARADAEYQFAMDHGLYQIGMHFAWDQQVLDDMPGWVSTITDPDELRAVLAERARVIFARYPGLDRIDVINEPFPTLGHELYDNHFKAVLGPDYIHQLFQIVQAEAPPSVELFINETGIEYQPKKADALVSLVADLKASGARVDAVGLQSHMDVGEPNWPVFLSTMQRLAALGVTPFISELDIPVPPLVPDRAEVLARRYRLATRTCLAVPACDTIDTWGASDSESWLNGSLYPGTEPLLLDDAYRPKPAYDAVRTALLGGRIDPATLNTTTEVPLDSGGETVRYDMECRPTSALVESGITQLSSVVHIFADGNPLRIPVVADLGWTPTATAGGAIAYRSDLTVDLSTVAVRYAQETGRPAVTLGGFPDLGPSTWLRLDATDVELTYATPAGVDGLAGAAVSGDSAATVATGPAGITTALAALSGDSRTPTPASALQVSWRASTATTAPAVIDLAPPTIAFTMVVQMGVVVNGVAVSGAVEAPFSCGAAGSLPIARTTVAGVPTGPTDPIGPTGLPTPVAAQPPFAG